MKTLLITGCSDPLRWYAGMIGQQVPYLGDVGDEYKSREPGGFVNFVQYADAMVIDSDEMAIMEIDESTIDGIARAFWRRIEPYKHDFDRELPEEMPVEFRAHMGTALCLLHPLQVNPHEGEIEMANAKADDYARLINEAREVLQEIFRNNGEDPQIEQLCSPLIDKLKLGL